MIEERPLDLDLTHRMVVREAMSSPVVALGEDEDIVKVAKTMEDVNLGAIIVADTDGKPLGIVTERDIVIRVVARGRTPRDVRAKEVMSFPLKMVNPDTPLVEAMTLMNKMNIRRLGVTYRGDLVGVVTQSDILRLVPAMIEILQERPRIADEETPQGPSMEGSCDRCGTFSTNLRQTGGEFLCEDCRAEAEA